jgi:hypothetical protein
VVQYFRQYPYDSSIGRKTGAMLPIISPGDGAKAFTLRSGKADFFPVWRIDDDWKRAIGNKFRLSLLRRTSPREE